MQQIDVIAVTRRPPHIRQPALYSRNNSAVIGSRFGWPVVPEVIANIRTRVPGANSAVDVAVQHALDVRMMVVVGGDRQPAAKVGRRIDLREAVVAAEVALRVAANLREQRAMLNLTRSAGVEAKPLQSQSQSGKVGISQNHGSIRAGGHPAAATAGGRSRSLRRAGSGVVYLVYRSQTASKRASAAGCRLSVRDRFGGPSVADVL